MLAEDFQYNGEYLKDWGFMICKTDSSSGFESIDSDSQLSFETVNTNGKKFEFVTSTYEDRIEITFQICKFSCNSDPSAITLDESRELKRWLNQPTYKKFKLIQPDWADIYMEGSFNVVNIEFNGKVYFLELTFISNRPFALHEPVIYKTTLSLSNLTYKFFDSSDEIGHIYPNLKIKCLKAGELRIENSNENRVTLIKNCTVGEIITFTPELLISTTNPAHKIQNDFNYVFLRVSNSYRNRLNKLTFSIPVEMELSYSPYVKAVQ